MNECYSRRDSLCISGYQSQARSWRQGCGDVTLKRPVRGGMSNRRQHRRLAERRMTADNKAEDNNDGMMMEKERGEVSKTKRGVR